MTPDPFRHALILSGPTGSGKTRLALDLARRLDAEIVSMDSMALYRHMDVGTAKPTAEERRLVPHHLLDVLDPWESASVAWWLERAAACCRDVEARGRRALIVGGTPLYLKALLRGLFRGPPADESIRRRLTEEAEHDGELSLHRRLAEVDPVSASRLHPHDVRRVVRALEVWQTTGRPISHWQKEWAGASPSGDTERFLWLDLPRPVLYARINARVEQMVAGGLVGEARALRSLGRPLSREAGQAVGYREMFMYLDGKMGLEEAVAATQQRSRNLAKRQLTWFRQMPEGRPVSEESVFSVWGLTTR